MFCIKWFYFLLSACLWLFNCHFQDHGIAKLIVTERNDSFLLFKMLIRNSGIFADMITSLLYHRKFKLVWKNNRGFLFCSILQCVSLKERVWFLEQGIWWYFPQAEFLVFIETSCFFWIGLFLIKCYWSLLPNFYFSTFWVVKFSVAWAGMGSLMKSMRVKCFFVLD